MKPNTLCDLARPVLRVLPWDVSIAIDALSGKGTCSAWSEVARPRRVFWDDLIRSYIICDLANWSSRLHYYSGRFYETGIQRLLMDLLKCGDTFIDVGANVGIHTLLAAGLIGSGGRVLAFEPNPQAFALLNAHLSLNDVRTCTTYMMGLGDARGEMMLSGVGCDFGGYTLRTLDTADTRVRVPIDRADSVIDERQIVGNLVIKIDVEGFEHAVLRGMPRLLHQAKALIVEVTPAWICEFGTSVDILLSELRDIGFHAETIPRSQTRGRLNLTPVTTMPTQQCDIVFTRTLSGFGNSGLE